MGSSGNLQQIDSLANDFSELVFQEKFIPRGSQEFREVLKLCETENDETEKQEFRTRSKTIDSTYGKKVKGVRFASDTISSTQERHVHFAEEHLHGTLHHDQGRRRSNTLDSSYKRNTKYLTAPGSSDVPVRKSSKSHHHHAGNTPETDKVVKGNMDEDHASQTSINRHEYHNALQKYNNRSHDVAFGTTQNRDFKVTARNTTNRDVIDKLQDDVSEVTYLMKNNIEKVVDRGDRLDDLQERSEELHSSSVQFQKSSRSLKRKMCCQNAKMTCCIIITVCVVIIVIVLIVLLTVKPWENSGSNDTPNHNKTLTHP